MRITIELDDDLVLEAKQSAAGSGLGFDGFIEHELREWLAEQSIPDPSSASSDGTWERGG